MKMYKNINLPYRVCDHIHIQEEENRIFYIDLYHGGYFVLPNEAHECITGDEGNIDGLDQYLDLTIENLISRGYIEPDLSKISVGKTSIYIPKSRWKPSEEIDVSEFYNDSEKEFKKSVFNIELVKVHQDLSAYEYLCERNSLLTLLIGYGIKHPLLWTSSGLFLLDNDFSSTGLFSTSFGRSALNTQTIPILGEKRKSLDWDIIDAHLEKNLPVLAIVDVYHMPYKSKTYYHSRHGSHSIILLEKRDSGYLVLDWYHPDYFYGEVTKKELEIARTSSNEKDQISVFNGHPIEAVYNLVYMDRFFEELDLAQYVRRNLYQSAKYLLGANGALAFFEKAILAAPEWLNIPGHEGYKNALESFFFFDLELKYLSLYYEEMSRSSLNIQFQPEILLEKTMELRKSVETLRNKLIFSFRRNKPIDENIWIDLLSKVNFQISSYCETLLKLLKSTKGI